MPKISFHDQTIECSRGENLRRVLLKHNLPLYNGISNAIHCRGLGTCGTCAVKIEGSVTPPTKVEAWRLNFPPHRAGNDLRLACQCKVLGDVKLTKFEGMWGQHVDQTESERGSA
jgi:ferredoxin